MTREKLLETFPKLGEYLEQMPEEICSHGSLRTYPPGHIVHQKDDPLDYFGIVCRGSFRVLNEFENGNIFMIEKNHAVDFIGEVTILAGERNSSVTIETLTECTVFLLPRKSFEAWILTDSHFLRLVTGKIAGKLYRSSYNRGEKLFYPSGILFMDYLTSYAERHEIEKKGMIIVKKTREEIREELGMTVKTINRTVSRLKEADLIRTERGKIAFGTEQYGRMKRELKKNHMG